MPEARTALDPILDHTLFNFSPTDVFTIRDACQGVQIFGETGSGKTSGSGSLLARSYLLAGFGGLVLTVKTDELNLWKTYAAQTGRLRDLIVIGEGSNLRFNLLKYECEHDAGGLGLARNLVELFLAVDEIVGRERGKNASTNDQFWQNELKKLIANAIDALRIADEEISFRNIARIIREAPKSPEDFLDEDWCIRSYCYQVNAKAQSRVEAGTLDATDVEDWNATHDYWRGEFPEIPEKTRSNIIGNFTGITDIFARGMLREQFCTASDVSLDETFQGKIIVLNLPVKRFLDAGLFAQAIFKHIWQRAVERRRISNNTSPVFLWADEAQFFVTSRDPIFLSTARGARVCTVFLSQNLPNYHFQLGGDQRAESLAKSMLGNLTTKIFHNNGCVVTNRYAADLFARTWQPKSSHSFGEREGRIDMQEQTHDELLDQVIPYEFTILATGGPRNDFIVEGIVHQGGRRFDASGTNFLKIAFPQNTTK